MLGADVTLFQAESAVSYASGHLIFAHDETLIATLRPRQPDVYVQSFPGPGTKSQVSRNGGRHPVWRPDGRELFYLGPDGTMMSVPIGNGRSFDAGLPQALFRANVWTLARNQVYAVTKDGQRFLVTATPQKSSGAAPLTVVLNWTAALNK